jgi:hypothetical protein
MNKKKNQLFIVLSIVLIVIIVFSGCSDRRILQKDETMLPSVQREDLFLIQQQSLHCFHEQLTVSTGLLEYNDEEISLTDQVLTGHVLATYTGLNHSFSDVLQRNLHSIVKLYNENASLFTLTETSLLLSLLYKTPKETSNEQLETDLKDRILSFRKTKQSFSTNLNLSSSAAHALSALNDYVFHTQNDTIQSNLSMLIGYYQKHLEKTPVTATEGYFIPWFTPSLTRILLHNPPMAGLYETIILVNMQLVQDQDTQNCSKLGRYSNPKQESNDTLTYQLHGLKSMIHAYNLSKTTNDTHLQNRFHQSVILNLIHLKNTVLPNTTNLSIHHHLTLLLLIDQAINVSPETNWSYLWESSTQTLITEKTLETSDTVWLALTIGVVFSICLLFIVFVLIKLYSKYKK